MWVLLVGNDGIYFVLVCCQNMFSNNCRRQIKAKSNSIGSCINKPIQTVELEIDMAKFLVFEVETDRKVSISISS